MANRYVICFSKSGYAKYTSHLDLLRFFKRAFRKTGVDLKYSQGFNPHPKISFAQPLSLGYSGENELLEFETNAPCNAGSVEALLKPEMPVGLEIKWCRELKANIKSLAGEAESALYQVNMPVSMSGSRLEELLRDYMAQEHITAAKRRKKDKKFEDIDIKNMIRSISGFAEDEAISLDMLLDCGSTSNCSPELVISSFCRFAGLELMRYQIEVERKEINFYNNLQI